MVHHSDIRCQIKHKVIQCLVKNHAETKQGCCLHIKASNSRNPPISTKSSASLQVSSGLCVNRMAFWPLVVATVRTRLQQKAQMTHTHLIKLAAFTKLPQSACGSLYQIWLHLKTNKKTQNQEVNIFPKIDSKQSLSTPNSPPLQVLVAFSHGTCSSFQFKPCSLARFRRHIEAAVCSCCSVHCLIQCSHAVLHKPGQCTMRCCWLVKS